VKEEDISRIFFAFQATMLVFVPALIYSYSKNLIMRVPDSKENPVNKKSQDFKNIIFYFYFSDQVVFNWVIFLIFSLLSGLFILDSFPCFHKIGVILWITYSCLIIFVAGYTYFSLRKDWRNTKNTAPWNCRNCGRLWIFLISLYSLAPAIFLIYYVRGENNILFELSAMGFSLGFYFWWHFIGGLIYEPLTSIIKLKKFNEQ